MQRDHARSTSDPIGSSQWKCHTPRFCSERTLPSCRGSSPPHWRRTNRSAALCAASNSREARACADQFQTSPYGYSTSRAVAYRPGNQALLVPPGENVLPGRRQGQQ